MAEARREAERLMGLGWRVWPLAGKRPTRPGFSRADGPYVTARPEWFTEDTEVAVLAGPAPAAGGGRFVCLDLDGPVPPEAIPAWPDTLTSKNGRHRWYRVAHDSAFRQTNGVRRGDGWAIDTRDWGGYARETDDGRPLWDDPTRTPATLTEAQVAELFSVSRVPDENVSRVSRPATPGPEPWTRESLIQAFQDPADTNYKAGGVGRVLYAAGWSPDQAGAYVEAILTGLGHPSARRHAATAMAAAREDSTAWGVPRLKAAGVVFVDAPREDISAIVLAADAKAEAEAGVFAQKITAGDMAAWDPPPISWLSEELAIAPGAPALITGYGGSGKTTFVQHLALSVAQGDPLLGAYAVRNGPVLHIDHEQGRDLTMRRYRALGVRADAALALVSFPRWSLADREPAARRAFMTEAHGHALIIIDSLLASCAAFLEDGENASSAREPLDFLTQVSEATGAVVLVIHHSKKDRSDHMTSARGSSAITDAVSVHITYERADLRPRTRPELTLGKVRHERPARAFPEAVTVAIAPRGAPADGGYTLVMADPADAAAQAEAEAEDAVMAALVAGPMRARELRAAVRGRASVADAAVRRLVESGLVIRTRDGYRLTGAEGVV